MGIEEEEEEEDEEEEEEGKKPTNRLDAIYGFGWTFILSHVAFKTFFPDTQTAREREGER